MSETYDVGTAGPDIADYESPGEADSGGYRETEAATEARIANQDQLPSPAESRAVSWGDNPEYYDETEPGSEYDGDTDTFIAGQDELPPPQESRAATWGDNPEYYDETDLTAEYDGGLSALITEENSRAAQDAPASPGAEDTHAESVMPPEDPADSDAQHADADNRDHDAATTADDELDQARTDLTVTEASQTPQIDETTAPRPDAHSGQADQTEVPEGDDGEVLPPEASRLRALEIEHDADRRKIADLEAELKAVKDEQAIRFDRIDQLLSSYDQQPAGAEPPEQDKGQPGTSQHQDAALTERESPRHENDPKVADETRGARWRAVVTGENVGAAGTLVGAADTVAQFTMHSTPEGMLGLGAMVLGLASLGLAKAEKHRKERHDRPDQRQTGEGAERSNN